MAKIKVYDPIEEKQEETFIPQIFSSTIKKTRNEFFPPWVWMVVCTFVWLILLPSLTAVIAGNVASGGLAGICTVLASVIAVSLFKTYTDKWRTIFWAMMLSLVLSYAAIKLPDFTGKLLMIVIPVGLFVLLRVNMNFRKMMYALRG